MRATPPPRASSPATRSSAGSGAPAAAVAHRRDGRQSPRARLAREAARLEVVLRSRIVRSTTSLRQIDRTSPSLRRAKVSRSFTTWLARIVSLLITSIDSRCDSVSSSRSRSCANALMVLSGLFTSCATPASSSPALASRSLSASRARISRSAVMSRPTTSICGGSASGSNRAASDAMRTRVATPHRAPRSAPPAPSSLAPPGRARCERSSGSTSSSSSRPTSCTGCSPTRSCTASFASRMRPLCSTVSTASGAARKSVRKRHSVLRSVSTSSAFASATDSRSAIASTWASSRSRDHARLPHEQHHRADPLRAPVQRDRDEPARLRAHHHVVARPLGPRIARDPRIRRCARRDRACSPAPRTPRRRAALP